MKPNECRACRGTGALPNGDACCACGCADRIAVVPLAEQHGALIFGWEPLAALLDDGLAGMVERHWQEVGVNKQEVPLDVDWEGYASDEEKGILHLMAARRGEALVGYASFYVLPSHRHYQTTRHALNDAIFVDPTQRGAGIGLIRAAERALSNLSKPHSIRVIYHLKLHVEASRGTLGRVFERLGYSAFETCFDKVVGG